MIQFSWFQWDGSMRNPACCCKANRSCSGTQKCRRSRHEISVILAQGGFYKHFGSKADLMAEAAENSLSQSLSSTCDLDVAAFVNVYVSRDHRDGRGVGCTMAALCGDAARQSSELKATFASGIENTLAVLEEKYQAGQDATKQQVRAKMIDLLAHAIGAVMLSRACPDDSPLADEILETCRAEIMALLPSSNET